MQLAQSATTTDFGLNVRGQTVDSSVRFADIRSERKKCEHYYSVKLKQKSCLIEFDSRHRRIISGIFAVVWREAAAEIEGVKWAVREFLP